MIVSDKPREEVRRPRLRIDETNADGRTTLAYAPLKRLDFRQLSGPGVDGKVIYELKKFGRSEFEFENGTRVVLTVEP